MCATMLVASAIFLAACNDSSSSSDCSADMKQARAMHPGSVTDSTLVSRTDKQLGWFYDDGSGTPLDHQTDFNWSSGVCVVTVLS
ncbi:MAG: hypothetical protein JWO39_342 [Gemmatimonadetes bacterium]|jgi:hypothetical protein|nr:hypothetical protein [Gemmatimonadota bacterium]